MAKEDIKTVVMVDGDVVVVEGLPNLSRLAKVIEINDGMVGVVFEKDGYGEQSMHMGGVRITEGGGDAWLGMAFFNQIDGSTLNIRSAGWHDRNGFVSRGQGWNDIM